MVKYFYANKKNFTTKIILLNRKFYQLKLPFNIDYMIPANDSVRLLSQFVEEMDLTRFIFYLFQNKRKSSIAKKMLKIMLYGYMNGLYSSRDIETACRRDINFMFLLEDSNRSGSFNICKI